MDRPNQTSQAERSAKQALKNIWNKRCASQDRKLFFQGQLVVSLIDIDGRSVVQQDSLHPGIRRFGF
jgi:hypothetical protein